VHQADGIPADVAKTGPAGGGQRSHMRGRCPSCLSAVLRRTTRPWSPAGRGQLHNGTEAWRGRGCLRASGRPLAAPWAARRLDLCWGATMVSAQPGRGRGPDRRIRRAVSCPELPLWLRAY
jgi:hypothetical protein